MQETNGLVCYLPQADFWLHNVYPVVTTLSAYVFGVWISGGFKS